MPYNLRRLVEDTIEHINTHNCEKCSQLAYILQGNIKGPFRTICYRCNKEINTAQLRVGTSGEVMCADCEEETTWTIWLEKYVNTHDIQNYKNRVDDLQKMVREQTHPLLKRTILNTRILMIVLVLSTLTNTALIAVLINIMLDGKF